MAEYVPLSYWPAPDRFAVGIQIKTLDGHLHSSTAELVQLNTGYSEELLVLYQLFEALNLRQWRLPRTLTPSGITVTGEVIHFLEARAEVMISQLGEQHPVIVQTFVGNSRLLLGRKFLRRLKVLLDGPGEQICLLRLS